ncbi:hypothetical protein T265_03898 [Opisthorchis viverrini]|uniref:Uncharacterized protein n=1 Tax=Opisthorchis viverrini TaxID=6198 RepID=A0A074ZUK4_OPIVI|nr:hypothetical protein T265_03898 [Opisthorchis viverrini]KER29527.1 hypothetical protein T265_03898 [Opisthorchis viverrini]
MTSSPNQTNTESTLVIRGAVNISSIFYEEANPSWAKIESLHEGSVAVQEHFKRQLKVHSSIRTLRLFSPLLADCVAALCSVDASFSGTSSFSVCKDTQFHLASDNASGGAAVAARRSLSPSLQQRHSPVRDPMFG